jgi:protein-tyrosine phosphatase
MTAPVGVLFVCLGNICRSPAAHAALASHVNADEVLVDSAGLGDWHSGELPDVRSRREGRARGFVVDHRARQVTDDDFDRFALIIAMDRDQVTDLRRWRGPTRLHHAQHLDDPDRGQIRVLRDWDPLAEPGTTLADPYHRDRSAFAEMFDTIERCIGPLVDELALMRAR